MGRIITQYSPAGGVLAPVIVLQPRDSASRQQHSSGQQAPSSSKTKGLTAYEVAVLLAIAAAILSCL